jgi:uncharacterized protein (DUF1330 family)
MSSLVIVNFNLLDPEKLALYSEAAALTVANYGGEFMVKGVPELLCGDTQYDGGAVIKFSDKATATAWYESAEYQKIIQLRNEAMNGYFQILG